MEVEGFQQDIIAWSLLSKAAIYLRETALGHMEINWNSRQSSGATWRLATACITNSRISSHRLEAQYDVHVELYSALKLTE